MMTTLYRLAALLLLWVVLQLALASCATTADLPAALSQPADSALLNQAHAVAAVQRLTTGRLKFNGPVTIQLGGSGNTAVSTDASKAKAPVAAAPHAVATEATTRRGTPWQVFAALVALGLAGGWLLRGQLKLPWPL